MALHVALASPYLGSNLGDTAILRSITTNLRAQIADVEFSGITLSPKGTYAAHGIEGTSLVAAPIEFFGSGRWDVAGADGSGIVAFAKKCGRSLRRKLGFAVRESIHWVRAFRYMRKVDVLLFAGGGQLDEEFGGPWGQPYSMFKWSTVARLTGTKVVVLSVGVCHLDSRLGRIFSRGLMRNAHYRSMRDPWSQAFVREQLAVDPVLLVPDLAVGLDVVALPSDAAAASQPLTIGVSPISYGHPQMWPNGNAQMFDAYLDTFGRFVLRLLEAGHRVRLFNTDSPDARIIELLLKRIEAGATPEQMARVSTHFQSDLSELLRFLAPLDFVVASRLHAVILAHLLGKPVLALSYDRKVTTHMNQIGQAEACVELHGASVEGLQAVYCRMIGDLPAISRDVASRAAEWRAQVIEQFARVRTLVTASSA